MNGNVLIVEDEEAIVNVLASILITNEYIPVVAKKGEQALMMLRSFEPDVVLLDLGLPDMDGLQVLNKIKEDGGILIKRRVNLIIGKNKCSLKLAV